MRRILIAILVACVLVTPLSASALEADGTAQFGMALIGAFANEQNPVISPLSAYVALAMAAAGAEGETRAQLLNALKLKDEEAAELAMQAIRALEAAQGSTKLTIANSAWLDDGFALAAGYAQALSDIYGAEAFSLDLAAQDTPDKVNAWVSEHTNGLIDKLCEEPYSEDKVLVLINALYLYAEWQNKFKEDMTRDDVFTLAGGEEVNAPFMRETAYFLYNEAEDGAQAIVLNYDDGKTAFLAVLPPEDEPLDAYIGRISAESLIGLIQGAEYARVKLALPKIETDNRFELTGALIDMGITHAFDPDLSELSLISADGKPLFISEVIQKVVVRVREDGTEAAAVTELGVNATSAMREDEPIELMFNRPYLYMVYDRNASTALFMGLVTNPSLFAFTQEKRAGRSIHDGAPNMTVWSEDGAEVISSNYSLTGGSVGVDACGMHPLEMEEMPKITLNAEREAYIWFELPPDEVILRYWPKECAGQAEYYESGFEYIEYSNDDALAFPKDGSFIVEARVKYEYSDLEGIVYYAFEIAGE